MRQIILPVFLKFIIIWAFVSACSHFWQAFIISLMLNVWLFIHCPKRTMEVVNERRLLLYIPRIYSKHLLLNSITSTFWGRFHALRIVYWYSVRQNYVRISNFTFQMILLYLYNDIMNANVGFRNIIYTNALPYKVSFGNINCDCVAFLFYHGRKFNHSDYFFSIIV